MKNLAAQIVVILILSSPAIAQKSIAALEAGHARALEKFLQVNQNLNFLDESNFNAGEEGMLEFARKQINPKLTPYYLAADFNRDGYRDFAVILRQGSLPLDQGETFSPSHRYAHKLMIVIFNGAKNKTYKPVFRKQVESPLVSFLYMTSEKKPKLGWSIIETDISMIISPAGNKYTAKNSGTDSY